MRPRRHKFHPEVSNANLLVGVEIAATNRMAPRSYPIRYDRRHVLPRIIMGNFAASL